MKRFMLSVALLCGLGALQCNVEAVQWNGQNIDAVEQSIQAIGFAGNGQNVFAIEQGNLNRRGVKTLLMHAAENNCKLAAMGILKYISQINPGENIINVRRRVIDYIMKEDRIGSALTYAGSTGAEAQSCPVARIIVQVLFLAMFGTDAQFQALSTCTNNALNFIVGNVTDSLEDAYTVVWQNYSQNLRGLIIQPAKFDFLNDMGLFLKAARQHHVRGDMGGFSNEIYNIWVGQFGEPKTKGCLLI